MAYRTNLAGNVVALTRFEAVESTTMTDSRGSDDSVSSAQARYDALRSVTPEHPCPYLPGRMARNEVYWTDDLDGSTYERLLGRGFRRSGRVVYRPRCRSCQECRQIRIVVDRFKASRSMRRVIRRNSDVAVEIDRGSARATDEKFDIYQRYLDAQHDGSMERTYESFRDFLCDSPIEGIEFRYRLGTRLIAVSVTDRCEKGLSSVYTYFDPAFRDRSLGTYSVLSEVEFCRSEGLRYYYLGYYVANCSSMNYKARFRAHEILVDNDRWLSFPE